MEGSNVEVEAWKNNHDLTTPWGFSLNEAFAALSFRSDMRRMQRVEEPMGKPCAYPPCEVGRTNGSRLCAGHLAKAVESRRIKREKVDAARRREQELRRRERELGWLDDRLARLERKEMRPILQEAWREYKRDREGPERTGYVYRLYDMLGTLLYVGKTYDLEKRFFGRGGHARRKPWWEEVTSIKVETYKDETEALIAEAHTIRRERPAYNISKPLPGTNRVPEVLEVNYYGRELQHGH